MKKCPYCAEEIQEEAIKCRFCNEFLDGRKSEAKSPDTKKTRWYFKTSTIVIGFLLIGPFIIPLIWFNPGYTKMKKAILTAVCIAITIILYIGMKASLDSLEQYYQLLQDYQ